MRKLLAVLGIAACLSIVSPTLAQDTPIMQSASSWTLSLYDQAAGTIKQVGSNGDLIRTITLPMPEGYDFYNYATVISPAGNLIAYLVSQVGDGSNPVQPTQLIVFDASAETTIATLDLDESITREGINAAGTSLRFSADGSRLIVGYYVPETDATGGDRYHLEVTMLNLTTGEVTNMADMADATALTDAGVDTDSAYFVNVAAFEEDKATIVLRPVFVNQDLSAVALNWDVSVNAITPARSDWVNAVDYFPSTNQALFLSYDPAVDTLAEGETRAEGAIMPPNTIELFDLNTGEIETLYAEDTPLISAKFVQNGTNVLAFADAGGRGILLDPIGRELNTFTNLPGDTFTFGVPAGFVYADPQQANTFVEVDTENGDYSAVPFYVADAPYNAASVQNYDLLPQVTTAG